MASQPQQPRLFRLGSFRPVQTTPQRPPPQAPAPQPAIIRPAMPRFRTPATQTTPPQETEPNAPPRQMGRPASPAVPAPTAPAVAPAIVPATETKPSVAQPLAPPTNPALNSSPGPSQTTVTPPPSSPLPSAVTPAPAVPRFRTPATQTTPPQETTPTALPRQIGRPAAPAPPPPTETRPTIVQPQAPLTNPSLNSSPAPSSTSVAPAPPPTTETRPKIVQPQAPLTNPSLNSSPAPSSTVVAPSPATSQPSAVTPALTTVTAPLPRAPPTQPNFATSKPASPQPRPVASATPSSPARGTEAVMQSSPQRTAAQMPVSSPRFPTDKSPVRAATPQSPAALKPQPISSVVSESPTRDSSATGNSFMKKSNPEPSTTPTMTSPMRKVSAPSPEAKTVLGSRSPPPSEPLPNVVPTPTSSPTNGKTLAKTPPQSRLIRPLSHPPSPFTLPPAQIKTAINHELNTTANDHTTVMTQARNGKPKVMPRVPDTYEFMETTYKYSGQDGEGKDVPGKFSEAEQSGMRVIRLAGENHGAIMELSPSRNKGNNNGRKTGTDYGNGHVEESSNKKNNKSMAVQAPPLTAFMNSNVQGLNNSIVFNTSYAHNDPGVHLSFSRKPNGGYVKNHIVD